MTDSNTVVIAEAKQREAMRREREAEDNEKMARIEIESFTIVFIPSSLRLLMEREIFIACVTRCWSMEGRGK